MISHRPKGLKQNDGNGKGYASDDDSIWVDLDRFVIFGVEVPDETGSGLKTLRLFLASHR